MGGSDVFFIVCSATTGGGTDSLDKQPTVRVTPEFSQIRFVVADGSTSIWQLNDGTDTENVDAGVVRPDDYHATTNAKVWRRVASIGSGSQMSTATVTFNNDQIKNTPLNTSANNIVSAPGLGKRILPVLIESVLNTSAGAYTNTHATKAFEFSINFPWGNVVPSYFWADAGEFQRTAVTDRSFWNGSFIETDVVETDIVSAWNWPLKLIGYSSNGGILTGGHANNTMKVTAYYYQVSL